MKKDTFFANIKEIEQSTWFSYGREIDGAPYTCLPKYWNWLGDAIQYFGGWDGITALVETRKGNGEELADPYCGNWWLWTILNELGVSRVRE